ncbi:MAG: ectoine hydroxylase [Sphingopyxis sp.]|uniref:ectoine hydroxylase n=1 Tax=Sphingopyxis sp. TaxID=1908224 RepID=UPI002AB8F6C8|nr:ectoine hydroxylase [Sphingopyxis sp.]MDZ3832856.1 ectoine hydroxylase [Sphingopyxis sp.]
MKDIYPSRHAARPEMLPRQDAVVHREWNEDAPVTREQAAQFDRDGYIVLEDIFTDEEVKYLQRAAGGLLADPAALDDQTIVTEPQSREIRSIFEIHRQSAVMARLTADARLADVARFLLGDEVYVHQSRLNYKPGFKGREFYWHSDFETWHVEDGMPRMRALSMSVLLAENTPHNGPLMVIPGSHRTYLTCVGETPDDHYLSSLKKQEYGVPDEDSLAEMAHSHGIVAPTGKPGTVVLFDCNLMHGSNGNITPFPRANAFLVYNAVSNRLEKPFGVEKPRPWFLAYRGEPQAIEVAHGPLCDAVSA